MREILSSLDIGSSKIKLVVAEILNGHVNVLCALEEQSRGVKKGAIYNPDETEYAIKKILKKAEETLGVKVTKTVVSVNEDSCDFKIGEAEIDIQEEGEVSSSIIQKVLQQSITGGLTPGNEIVTIIPIRYKVDDVATISTKGIKGKSLQVKTVIVSVPKREIYGVAKILEKCNCSVVDVMIPSMGAYYANRSYLAEKSQSLIKESTGIVIDIGAEVTNIGVINKGIIINNNVLPLGGNLVDQDLSFIYKLDNQVAKEVKETFALANKRNASVKTTKDVVNTLGEKITLNQYEVSEVCMSRVHEMLNTVKNEINYLTKKEISYIIITGGLSEFKGFNLEVESVFGPLAKIGKVNVIGARDNKFACAIGMIKYFDEKLGLRDKEFSILSQDDLDVLSGSNQDKSNSSLLNRVFGKFFDN
jgi:cell division protein FtsA